jgi:DNA-binding Lrp family transcriptional regulator
LPALDCTDQAILVAVGKDARLSNSEIARQTGIPERTVHHRLRRMIDAGWVKTTVVVNPHAFGYDLAVDIFCEMEPGSMSQAADLLLKMPEISYLAMSTGDQDLSIQAFFQSIDEMQAFITEKLHQVPGLRRTRTVLTLQLLKDTYEWRPPSDCFHKNGRGEVQPAEA